jgi:hypothetical protein
MQKNNFEQKIRAAVAFWREEMDLLQTTSSMQSLAVDPEFSRIALAPESTYQEIYLSALSRSAYNINLNDFSMFQFSWANKESWRLAYLPNPWISGVQGALQKVETWEALQSLGRFDEAEVATLISELPYYGSIPSIRFEYAAAQYRELSHPAGHMHIGRHAENRWPLARTLNPLTFSMFIAKMYYSDEWAMKSSFYQHAGPNCIDMRFIKELSHSPLVRDFSANEKNSLHLSCR